MNNFNNYFPQKNQFSPYFNNNPANETSASTNNIVWVQGIEGAKAWQLPPNSMIILLDSEAEGKMYIKVSDNIGMSTLRIFNYVEEIPKINNTIPNENIDLSQYVKKDELMKLVKEVLNEQSLSTTSSTSTNESESGTTKSNTKIVYTIPDGAKK